MAADKSSATRPKQKPLSMHEGIADWSDPICVCEAEPYWAEVAEEMGIDIHSDREPDKDSG